MRVTAQEVILRFTTVPAGYTGGNAFNDLNTVKESSTAHHMKSNATTSVKVSSTAYHMKSCSFGKKIIKIPVVQP